ncbi:hypothetical protein ABH937_005325 [Kitasatospora sp. GAS1066B]
MMGGMTDAAESTDTSYCAAPGAADATLIALAAADPAAGPRADCVLCGEPTEFPAGTPGSTLCARCAWQQAQRGACSG